MCTNFRSTGKTSIQQDQYKWSVIRCDLRRLFGEISALGWPPTQHSNRSETTNFFSFQSMMPNWTAVMTPCRESLSSYRQAVDINVPLRDKHNLLYAHIFSMAYCAHVILAVIGILCIWHPAVRTWCYLAFVQWIFPCLSEAGLGFHLFCHSQEFSALELHIKECNRRLCTHTWLTVTRTDVGSDYKGSHYNRCYEYYMS